MDTTRRLAVSSAIALTVASCATAAPNRSPPQMPANPTPVEVPPVLVNEDEVRQEALRAYPPELLAEGLGGRVEVWVRVDTAGRGWSGDVKTSSGHDELDCAAMQVGDIMYDEYREERYAPPPLLRRLVAMGRHGRKSGAGFYDWTPNGPVAMRI